MLKCFQGWGKAWVVEDRVKKLCVGAQMIALLCVVALAADAPPLMEALNLAPS